MNAPICEFVARYAASGAARLHMPGHKGRGSLGFEDLDITEIDGADALYEATGIIAESEANATALFGTARTCYSTEGSSQCIRAMLMLALTAWRQDRALANNSTTARDPSARPVALAGRNAHRAFLTAAALNDFDVEWLWPEELSTSPCACPISPEGLANRLDTMSVPPFCVYVTSPDYLGGMLDIRALAELCHARGVPLLVDDAHGAYLKFLPEPLHPMELGADLCCDSAHKTLPALTGAAYLHVGQAADPRFARDAKRALALFGSTSPSYLILQSLDRVNLELSSEFPARLAHCRARVDALKATLRARGFDILPSDPMKLTLHTDGPRTAHFLRHASSSPDISRASAAPAESMHSGCVISDAGGVEPEMVEKEHVVLMFSPHNSPEDFRRVYDALRKPLPLDPAPKLAFPTPPRVMSIREAMFAPFEEVPIEQAIGHVCASPTASCPPAVAVVAPGEIVTPEVARAIAQCGIERLFVIPSASPCF